MKRLMPLALAAVFGFAGSAFAQTPLTTNAKDVQAVDYHYGMHLDIQRVIHITDNSDKMGVVPATITFIDSSGMLRKVNYLELGGYDRSN
ncbi:DUF2790 domain-containing protein [Pseudomonas sp. UBA2684]|uniref:DUF2790 domain-containing protein n=2 Tax=Pseudomonas TaxID=286 RepID=UPI000E8AAA61|nr:DUF2790 domain-containing protein [Pseudomonas sp. UBA2684]HBX56252.1 DUF2790 domain-containing protein [Pseudomonas sp.]